MPDAERGRGPVDDPENPLLTPQEWEARRAVRRLRERSDQLVRESQRVTRPKELPHHFPPPGNEQRD